MSGDLSDPGDLPLSATVARLSERVRGVQGDVAEIRAAVADVDRRLRRIEWVGVALAASGLLGGGAGVASLLGPILGLGG